ncbi:hypothetical protein BZA70DRAFT_308975 [Myxozyma melibiosi]|uniref:rRNA biogenesis protein RRP36 n=1 Tax=Myxozyma melibiosi TaxID=54550 RepID=A0ABR1FEQ0_9ASCO
MAEQRFRKPNQANRRSNGDNKTSSWKKSAPGGKKPGVRENAKSKERFTPAKARKEDQHESGDDSEDDDDDGDEFLALEKGDTGSGKKQHKRSSKHAPQEISAKKPVGRFREVVEVPKIIRRDPRFEALSGKFDDTQFRKNYGFLNEYRERELAELKERMAKTRDPVEVARMKKEYQSLESKLKAAKKKEFEKKVLKEAERKERELVKQGKKPFYMKKSDKRKLVLTQKFSEMKKSDVDRAIQRRRKKNISKERKKIPFARSAEE